MRTKRNIMDNMSAWKAAQHVKICLLAKCTNEKGKTKCIKACTLRMT
jgi:hypothetical protein